MCGLMFQLIIFQLWENRIAAGCDQFGIDIHAFREGLSRNGIMLNRFVL